MIGIFHAKNVLLLDKVYPSKIYEAEAGLENAQFSVVSDFIKTYTSPSTLDDGMKWNLCWPKTIDDWWKEIYNISFHS